MAYIVRVWLLTPPAGFVHPKTEVLRVAARRGKIALRAKKIDASGAMRVVCRGASEELAAFNGDLHHKVKDSGWQRNELTATEADVASIEGGGVVIVRSEDSVTSGVGSSGRAPPSAVSETSSIDTGSSASSRLVVFEVKRERERNEEIQAAAAAAAAAHEVAALEAAAAAAAVREAAAFEASVAALMTYANMTREAAEKVLRASR